MSRHTKADSFEYAVRAYLQACGYRTFGESLNYQNRGAPLIGGEPGESYRAADIPAIKGGHGAFFEVKWKEGAFLSKYGNLVTGIDLDPYNDYLRHESDSGWPLVIVFCHETENEIRCGTLAQLREIESHRCSQSAYPRSKGGMVNWHYREIPLWTSYASMSALADAYAKTGVAPRSPTLPFEIKQPAPERQPATASPQWHQSHENRQTFLNIDVDIRDLDRGNGGRRARRR